MSVPMPICSTMRLRAMPVLSPLKMRARVSGLVNRQKALGFDRGVALCRRQACVTQQLLDGAQIAAGTEQMGCKAVAESVRGRGFGQTQTNAQRGHLALHDPRVER